jgi:hypothetical protein
VENSESCDDGCCKSATIMSAARAFRKLQIQLHLLVIIAILSNNPTLYLFDLVFKIIAAD